MTWFRKQPDPEAQPPAYYPGRTDGGDTERPPRIGLYWTGLGWSDWEEEQAEKVRVRNLEKRWEVEQAARRAQFDPRHDLTHAPPPGVEGEWSANIPRPQK